MSVRLMPERANGVDIYPKSKDIGFDLKATRLRSIFKLHRLTFIVVVLFLDLVVSGSRAIEAGQRRLVDRSDRRDIRYFSNWSLLARKTFG